MDSIRLMNRVDTKYVTSLDMLGRILDMARADYYVLETSGGRVAAYDSMYFDTPSLDMYMTHQCGRLVRRKVRTRTYVASGDTFLEVKRKNNHGRTKKKRIQIDSGAFGMPFGSSEAAAFATEKSGYDASTLIPSLGTAFDRITLVSKSMTERLTIDTHLRFSNLRTGLSSDMGGLVVIEIKQDSHASSPMADILSQLRIHPMGMSKYCIGTALTSPGLRQNRFKPRIHKISKYI